MTSDIQTQTGRRSPYNEVYYKSIRFTHPKAGKKKSTFNNKNILMARTIFVFFHCEKKYIIHSFWSYDQ